LLPGDVILTGTPGGVGAKRKAALVDLINKKRSGQPITKSTARSAATSPT